MHMRNPTGITIRRGGRAGKAAAGTEQAGEGRVDLELVGGAGSRAYSSAVLKIVMVGAIILA